MRVYLFRHGATCLSLPPLLRMIGRLDPPLNPLGVEQAKAAARRAERFGARALFASPLGRARKMAEIIGEHLCFPVEVLPELREIDYGEWEGKPVRELERNPYFKAFRADPEGNPPPAGEEIKEVARRMLSAIHEVARRAEGGSAIVVGHRTANRLLLCLALGAPLSRYRRIGQDLACLNVLEVADQVIFALTINDTCHLEEVERKCPSTG